MTLFISNPSTQEVVFYYRRAITNDSSGPSAVPIRAGGQVEIGHNWAYAETEYVIRQIIRAGGASAAEAHGRMGKFTGLLYREKHPVDVDEIVTANEAVKVAAEQRSVEKAQLGAQAFDLTTNQRGRGQRIAKLTEVEIKQELPRGQRPTGNEVHFKQTVAPPGAEVA
jgi:hypothetical protein